MSKTIWLVIFVLFPCHTLQHMYSSAVYAKVLICITYVACLFTALRILPSEHPIWKQLVFLLICCRAINNALTGAFCRHPLPSSLSYTYLYDLPHATSCCSVDGCLFFFLTISTLFFGFPDLSTLWSPGHRISSIKREMLWSKVTVVCDFSSQC